MTLKEILDKCRALDVYMQRRISEEYSELVFFNRDTEQWNKILTDVLGPAIKPVGAPPTEVDLRLTKAYGGISDHQTLFKKEFDGIVVIAMFWPWQDNERTTLKMVHFEKQQSR